MRAYHSLFRPRVGLWGIAIVCAVGLSACSKESSETLLSKAQASLKVGDKKAATIQLKNAIQQDGHNAEARFQLAKLLMEQGDYAAAEKELRRAREARLSSDKVNPLLARALIKLGEFQRVLDEIPVPAAGSATESVFLVARANAQLGLKQPEEARKSLERALIAAPNDAEVHLAWARMSIFNSRVSEAFQHVDTALKFAPNHLEAWLFKGDLLRASQKPTQAGEAYQVALKIDPQHHGARLALAGIAISENRLGDAKALVDTVLKATPSNLLGHYTQALIDYREKEYTAGRDHLAGVLKTAPDYLPALLLNGANEYAMGNLQTAETSLNKVVKISPQNIYALRLLAATQLRLGRADDASRTLAPALRTASQDVGVQVVAGEIALANKDFSKASEHFEVATKASPGSAAIRTELGLSRMAQGDSRGMADFQVASGMEGGDIRPATIIILTQLKNKQFDAALTSLAALEKKQAGLPLIWNYRGAAYLGKQDRVRARSSYMQALKLDPSFFPAAVNLAQLDMQDKQPQLARQRFEDILKTNPTHLNAMLALADLSLLNKDEKAYIGWLEKAANAHQQAIQPRILMARYLLAKGENAKAITVAREAVNAQPQNAAALDTLGATQYASKDLANALGTYQKLTDMYPRQAEPRLKLAQVQIAMKQPGDARKTLQEALRLKPAFTEAQSLLGSLEIQSARYDEAQKIAKQMQLQVPDSPAGLVLEGDTALARKQYTAAITVFERAHHLSPSPSTLIRLHKALAGAGRAEEGERQVAGWLASHPQDNGTRLFLAERLTVRGQFKTAADHYLYLNQQNPGNLLVLNNLAWVLSELKDRRALSFAEQALKLKPDNPAIQDTLGWILVQQGQSARGIKLLQQALSKTPDAAEIHFHLAAAYAKSGDQARARSELERLLASGVGFSFEQEAHTLLKQLQEKNAPII